MFLAQLTADHLIQGAVLYLVLLICLSVHEWAHAWSAWKLGDDTAKDLGRITFNPAAHIDPIGTILIPLFMILFSPGFAIIGWGKPVPVDPRNFRGSRVRGDIFVSMAGPASNLVLALIVVLLGGVLCRIFPDATGPIFYFVYINLLLACFNCLPIPPLDGSHVLKHVIRMSEETYFMIARWGFLIIILLLNFTPLFSLLRMVIGILAVPYFFLFEILAGVPLRP